MYFFLLKGVGQSCIIWDFVRAELNSLGEISCKEYPDRNIILNRWVMSITLMNDLINAYNAWCWVNSVFQVLSGIGRH